MLIKGNEVLFFVGTRGSGKTTLLKYFLKRFTGQGYRVLIYDPEHEFEFEDPNIEVYKPSDPESIEEFDSVCRKVWARKRMILAVESIDFFAIPKTPLPKYFKRIVHWGRKRGVGLWMTSRRIADVHKSPCSQVHHWFVFYTFLPNDTSYLKKFIGPRAEECKELKEYHFLYWKRGQARIYPPIKVEDLEP